MHTPNEQTQTQAETEAEAITSAHTHCMYPHIDTDAHLQVFLALYMRVPQRLRLDGNTAYGACELALCISNHESSLQELVIGLFS